MEEERRVGGQQLDSYGRLGIKTSVQSHTGGSCTNRHHPPPSECTRGNTGRQVLHQEKETGGGRMNTETGRVVKIIRFKNVT